MLALQLYNFLFFFFSFHIYGCNLKIINASQGYIHKYENLKKEIIQLQCQHLFQPTKGMSHLKILFSFFRATMNDTPLGKNLSF